jgi:LysR family transcriptional regulator, glycine cleavage system transcriptional activator
MRTSPTLPPLPSLRAFAAAARLLSFRKAGEDLLITQSAVSHHVRQLEDWLGTALFVRHGRSISLTPAGRTFLDAVETGFAAIEAGARALRGDAEVVRVSLLPSFAANWLVPRLPDFRVQHPQVAVELDPTLEPVDLAAGSADLAIRYGSGPWPGAEAELLMGEALIPVASPALLAVGGPVEGPEDLLRYPLLLSRRASDWEVWAEAAGLDLSRARRVQLVDYNVVLQAAADGQGIAMGRAALVRERLRSGALVAPLPLASVPDRAAYWLLRASGRPLGQGAKVFAAWLTGAAEAFVREV